MAIAWEAVVTVLEAQKPLEEKIVTVLCGPTVIVEEVAMLAIFGVMAEPSVAFGMFRLGTKIRTRKMAMRRNAPIAIAVL